jgi:hypothetical protein
MANIVTTFHRAGRMNKTRRPSDHLPSFKRGNPSEDICQAITNPATDFDKQG